MEPKLNVYFEDPRLNMSFGGRLLVRVLARIFLLVAFILTLALLISDIPSFKWLGAFMTLFFLDIFIHRGEPDKPLSELPSSGKTNLANYIEPKAFRILEEAKDKVVFKKTNFHLQILSILLEKKIIKQTLERMDVSSKEFLQKLDSYLVAEPAKDIDIAIQDLMSRAFLEAMKSGGKFIGILDIFAALGRAEEPKLRKLLSVFSVSPEDFEGGAVMGKVIQKIPFWGRIPRTISALAFRKERRMRHRVINRAWTSRPTPLLDRFGLDFTDIARVGHIGFMVGHKKEYNRLIESISRSLNPNAILIGDAGSGKETIMAFLASNLVNDEVPQALFDRRLVSLDISLIVASASPEELQSRLINIVEEIEMAGNIILYIPDIHNLVKTSGTAFLSAADALMPVIMNSSFPVIGSTYPREYKQLIEPRSDFGSLFEPVQVEEITEEEAERVLMYEGLRLERVAGVRISLGAIRKSVSLAKKYFRDKPLPSSAEELMKSAFISMEQKGEKVLNADGVISIVEEKINVPLREADEAETERLLKMEDIIHERLVDQEEAVKAVASVLREYRSGLSRKGGPIASFLFVGPTGVGKTELAKILASLQFGSEEAMIRFDMTEYQDKQSFMRFIGSPDQTVSGALTDAVREKPYSLILLDEFEKAYPDILNLFLQVFDDGRLTDNQGRVVDFQNTIIIATSNARSDFIIKSLSEGGNMKDISEKLKKELVGVFRPELLNRFSKIIVFKNLEPEELVQIATLNLRSLSALLSEQGSELSFTPEAIRKVAELGYDPAFGARPLRRVIDEVLKARLSEAILRREIKPGSKILVDLENGEFLFQIS